MDFYKERCLSFVKFLGDSYLYLLIIVVFILSVDFYLVWFVGG